MGERRQVCSPAVGEPVDLEAVIEEIRRTAAEKTASGFYPADLEARLASGYAAFFERTDNRDRFDALRVQFHEVDGARGFGRHRIETSSGVPGGELLHRAAGKVVSRQINGIVDQLNQFTDQLLPLLRGLISVAEEPAAHTHSEVLHEIDALQERLTVVERSMHRATAQLDDLHALYPRLLGHLNEFDGVSARLAVIEERERRRGYEPTFSSRAFADATRGAEADMRTEYAALADTLAVTPGPVLDIGAGRGELLSLLRERGKDGFGVEIDPELVALAEADGLAVQLGDGIDVLRAQAPASLGAITLIHVIEHLHPNELLDVLTLAYDRLAHDGVLVLETPNPQSLYVYARAFWIDPTHVRPVHPVYLDFALRQTGFTAPVFEWLVPPSADEQLLEIDADIPGAERHNENVRRLNQLVFAAQNYRVLAAR
jgi:SAM-dependent methyltransferase